MSKGEVTSSGGGGGESADLALANRRSRSRGRTPSELLARKQRLASAGRLPLDGADQQDQRKMANGSNQNESDYQPLSAEAKLESLSALLRHHQVSSMELGGGGGDETTSTTNQSQHQEQLKSVDDVYILLAKKEKDLQLAAELGKVLLERNEDLSRANERIAEEYSHKLELLEQEKHKLKRKLDQLDGEYENRLIELQTDCNILKNKLEQQQQAGKQAEKEKSKLIEDLVQQNQRLTSELAEATRSEELLASQLEQVNERLSSRLSNRSNHVAQVDALQEEIQILNQRKQDLERRLKLAQGDKSNLNGVIDELGDKILLCENLLNEKDLKIGELAIEIGELRDSSAWLSARLESMISLNERLVASVVVNSDSEHNATDLTAISERDRSQLVEQLKELRLRRSSRIKANELILAEADERRRRSLMKPAAIRLQKGGGRRRTRRQRGGRDDADECSLSNDNDSTTMSDNELDLDSETSRGELQPATRQQNLSELISEIFFILNNFLAALQQRKESLQISTGGGGGGSPSSSHHQTNGQNQQQHSPNEDSGIGSSADELKAQDQFQRSTGDKSTSSSLAQTTTSGADDLEQWRRLINEVRQLIEELPCSSCQLMIGERSDFEQLRKTHTKLNDEIRLKNDELLKLNGQNIELGSQLSVLQDKCRLLKEELESCDRPTDEIVKQAWKTRDEAVSRKNNAEIQLAKTRIENMQISSQLMEVVQQKGELSQKLAQFEDDIHYMMQRSVRQRFSWEEYAEEARRNGAGGRSKSRQSNGTSNVRMTTANQLINLVPSIVSSNGNAQGSSSIQQLLSLTGVNLLTPTKTKRPDKSSEQHHISQDATSNGSIVTSSSQLDGLGEQNKSAPTATQNNLLTSLKSGTNRFNLRFWQRNNSSQESEQTPDKMIVDSAKS